jgi:hypothetical protein
MILPVRRPLVVLVALALAGLAGCSGQQKVTGNVTLDGAPVDGGVISFVPKDESGGATPKGGPITGGKYAVPLGAGSYRVEISWPKKTGRKVGTPGDPEVQMDETVEAVPSNYNSASTLSADVKPGATTFNFDLKSQGQSQQAPAKGD